MALKIGDKVRLTREAILKHPNNLNRSLVLGGELLRFDEGFAKVSGSITKFQTHNLELVPEEPEFEYGEEIEVSRDGKRWEKRIYLTTINLYKKFYICVSDLSVERYNSGLPYSICECPYARRRKPQLTRKEIAEKLGVDEDFILVD